MIAREDLHSSPHRGIPDNVRLLSVMSQAGIGNVCSLSTLLGYSLDFRRENASWSHREPTVGKGFLPTIRMVLMKVLLVSHHVSKSRSRGDSWQGNGTGEGL